MGRSARRTRRIQRIKDIISSRYSQKGEVEIYVSMTSIPGREESVQRTLDSLLEQSVSPTKTFFSICNRYKRFSDKKYDESYLEKYISNNQIKLIHAEEDYGPVTRLFSALDNIEPNDNIQYILLLDDDAIFKPYLVESYFDEISKDPTHSYSYSTAEAGFGYYREGQCADSWAINIKHLKYIREYHETCISDEEDWFNQDDYLISSYLYITNTQIRPMYHRLRDEDKRVTEGSGQTSLYPPNESSRSTAIRRRDRDKRLADSFFRIFPKVVKLNSLIRQVKGASVNV